ncbi:MAG: hypothetical protein L0027_04725 [Candidatus Rokubacteria bacterium]|nr:hypothetical protein [Candidatus Rokubacteria bacterium]
MEPADEPFADAPGADTDSGQIELFADHVVASRELDAAIAAGRFEEANCLRLSMDAVFSPSETSRCLAPLDLLAGVAWEGPPPKALSVWAEIDTLLADRPSLRARVRTGAFTRLLRSHSPRDLLAARPDCLPALAHALRGCGRSPEEGRLEARALVRDSLLAGRTLDALAFREDETLADLLAEDLPPRWLACLGRIRRLWPGPPPRDSEWEALREIARGEVGSEDPALVFWHCLRLAESPSCPDDLRHQARRRMKQLHPDLHRLFMRRAAPE